MSFSSSSGDQGPFLIFGWDEKGAPSPSPCPCVHLIFSCACQLLFSASEWIW